MRCLNKRCKISDCMRGSGFTLIELITVLTVISILAALLFPYSASFLENLRLFTGANAVKHQLYMAKTRALDDPEVHCGVYIDTINHLVQTYLSDGHSGSDDQYDPDGDQNYLKSYKLPESMTLQININNTNCAVIFRGDGTAKIPGMDLTIRNRLNETKHIHVLPSTGRIKLY